MGLVEWRWWVKTKDENELSKQVESSSGDQPVVGKVKREK